ncbi:helix-turn-helix transcriptional regulator [Bradyrhizobium sp. USDA 10063]
MTGTVGNERNKRSPGLFYLRRASNETAMSQTLISFEALASKGIDLSKAQLLRLERAGKFPSRVTISHARIAWIESEIDQWIAARIAARQQTVAA